MLYFLKINLNGLMQYDYIVWEQEKESEIYREH